MSVRELQHALATEIGKPQLDEENIPEISIVVLVCAGLVAVDKNSNVVRLIHYTADEYFAEAWTIVLPTAHKDIATICINYLSLDAFQMGAFPRRYRLKQQMKLYALYKYAALNWGHHARIATIEQETLNLDFLKSKAKVNASVEAIIHDSEFKYFSYFKYEPEKVMGLHLAAHFGLWSTIETLLRDGHCSFPLDGPLFYLGCDFGYGIHWPNSF